MANGASRTTIEKLLKEVYIPGVNRQVNDEVLFLNRLESSADNVVEGLKVVVSVDLGRTAGIGPAREGNALPAAGSQRPERATFNLKSLYGRGMITGQAQRSSRTNQASFLRAMKFEADGLKRDLRKDLARQVYGGSDIAGAFAAGGVHSSAAIAKIASVAADVITLTSDAPIRQGHIYVGMILDATDDFVSIENGGTGAMEVEAVNLSAKTVTTVANHAADLAANDFLVRRGTVDASGNAGITGVSAIVNSTGAYGGLNPATAGQEAWRSLTDTAGGAFASDNLHALFNQVRMEAGEAPRTIVTSFGLIRSYFNELQAQVQFVEPMKLEGGFRVLNFMDRPFIGDVDCPLGTIYLVDESSVRIASESPDFAPLDEGGHFLHWVTGFDKWEWALQRDMELITDRRNSSAKMTGLTDLGY